MAGWGAFDLTAGLQGLQQIGDRFTQLRDELEQSIEETIRAERFGVLPDAEAVPEEGANGEGAAEGWGGGSEPGSPLAVEAAGGASNTGGDSDASGPPVPDTLAKANLTSDAAAPLPAAVAGEPAEAETPAPAPAAAFAEEAAVASLQEAGPASQLGVNNPPAAASPRAAASPQQPAEIASSAAPASSAKSHRQQWQQQQSAEGGREAQHLASKGSLEQANGAEQPPAGAAIPSEVEQAHGTEAQQLLIALAAEGAAATAAVPVRAGTPADAPAEQQQPEPAASCPSPSAAADRSSQEGSPNARGQASPAPANSGDDASLDAAALRRVVGQLREALAERERQIERKGEEAAQLAAVAAALQRKNEELVQGKDGEAVAALQREFETKLAAAERKVYALTKERDALKRGSEKLSTMDDLVREKDEIIKQVMAEGEALSKKQLAQEQTIKKLRAQARELQAQVKELNASLEAERSKAASAVSERATTAGELYAIREQHTAELAAERQHYERLLEEARAGQAEAESRAAEAAKLGAARRLKEAEARAESLEGLAGELRAELERQRAAADEREELLAGEVADLQRRCAEAEARQQEAAARIPEATSALMRQLEAMQAASSQQAAAWAEAERGLQERLRQAEAAAGGAAGQAAHLGRELEEVQAQLAAATEQLSKSREALTDAQQAAEMERQRRVAAETTAGHLRADLASAQDSLNTLEKVYAQQIESLQAREASALSSLKAMEGKLKASSANGGADGDAPPALAAPGFTWVLVKEGQETAAAGTAGGAPGAWLPRNQSSAAASSASDSFAADAAAAEAAAAEEDSLKVGGSLLWGAGGAGRAGSGALGAAAVAGGRSRDQQLAALQQQVRELELTRDRLSEELVRAATEAAAGQAAAAAAAAAEQRMRELGERLTAAVELLGEKEELLEEARVDMEEMRQNYRHQIEFMAEQLTAAQAAAAPPARGS